MIVVSDASAIIGLSAIGQLQLLQTMYQSVDIPEAVYREVTTAHDLPDAKEVREATWIRRHGQSGNSMVAVLTANLDQGESEAIALELKADLILMDERRDCFMARRMGLEVIGVLGVLVEAKLEDHLPELKPVLDALVNKAGFRISDALYQRALIAVGE